MNNLRMQSKLLLIAIVPMMIALFVALAIIANLQANSVTSMIDNHESLLRSERQKQISDAVKITQKIIQRQMNLASANNLNQQQSLADVRDLLKQARYGDNNLGYFFIYDSQGINIADATNEANQGQNRFALQDKNGVMLIQELIKASQSGGGFVEYVYPKPGTDSLQPKLSYSAPIASTDWFIGTGVYIDDIEKELATFSASTWQQLYTQIQSAIISAIVLVMLTSLVMLWIAKRVANPINDMLNTLNDIADGEGDLTRRLDIKGSDEIAQLGGAFNRFTSKLQCIISAVADVTHQVTDSATSLSQQTQKTTEQLTIHNNETDQVVTAVTQMNATANDVAENVIQVADATKLATQDSLLAQDNVSTSNNAITNLVDNVEQASGHMSSLHDQSQKIDHVLQVIGAIADQTNLLALNAAIEAARAGEQGRGFAVVADEVRSLASRTQDSTLEIKVMLDGLHQFVAQAVSAMKTSQETSAHVMQSSTQISGSLSAVTDAVDAINDMTTHIATAATEQSSVSDEINRNMINIRDVVTQLLASSHETTQVSTDLSAAGKELETLLSQFKLS
ncbi:methyl-accepting chemotaxis protein [Moritella sp. Urea-trap-13]|uniref:methyl-accepting chemotaxis protein n=1 Tax=Moritella sp. Urea-trap-13 TaxID=2058327 RepID=UPI000C324BC3|nr:methyl-accepting chemotaxis protein [Moritella sp. Urea-trap-13]PKH09038.1 chemotaxis protein [Moritella sp. Urea-trap-13]